MLINKNLFEYPGGEAAVFSYCLASNRCCWVAAPAAILLIFYKRIIK
ncbi:hypothetical protein OH686_06635 [Pseudomonas sp. SO81]|nr:hypothetical protein OH686_06635 [Pseudomonas sp. SO81]